MIALGRLALRSVTEPRAVARDLMAIGLAREALWTALALAAVLNAALFTLARIVAPGTEAIPGYAASPAILLLLLVGGLVITVFAIFWTGRAMGGEAALGDVLVLVAWLQFLRVALQAAVLVLGALGPAPAALAGFAGSAVALWILVNFVAAAHGFESLLRAAMVLLVAVGLMAFGLAAMLSLIGLTGTGVSADV